VIHTYGGLKKKILEGRFGAARIYLWYLAAQAKVCGYQNIYLVSKHQFLILVSKLQLGNGINQRSSASPPSPGRATSQFEKCGAARL
jgi:hypothetical protein